MNAPRYIRTPEGSRVRVEPGSRGNGGDPANVYESDVREMAVEALQYGPWADKADVLETYFDAPFAALVAFVCTYSGELGCISGTPEQRERLNETFVGLAEEASKRLDAQIEEHLRSTWGRQPYEPGHYDIAEGD